VRYGLAVPTATLVCLLTRCEQGGLLVRCTAGEPLLARLSRRGVVEGSECERAASQEALIPGCEGEASLRSS